MWFINKLEFIILVISVDIDEVKIKCAKNNARIYGNRLYKYILYIY